MKFRFAVHFTLVAIVTSSSALAESIETRLGALPDRVICEGYENDNWELFVMEADGSNLRNLTNTPDVHELYPQVSPDGSQIAFISDSGTGRSTVRSVWVMDVDGSSRRKIADYARQPFWSPDGKTLAYLPQEFTKFNVVDYSTKGLVYHDLQTGADRPHPNSDKIHHLYNPGFSPDGKWIIATVHGGMGLGHGTLLIEADGDRIVNLKTGGCRPTFSPCGKFIAWGPGDHEIRVVDFNWDEGEPSLGKTRFQLFHKTEKIYHVDWSPDGQFLTVSKGKSGRGDLSKPGTHSAACEIVGVYADNWNIVAVSVELDGKIDLMDPPEGKVLPLTTNGQSYKESDWIPASDASGR